MKWINLWPLCLCLAWSTPTQANSPALHLTDSRGNPIQQLTIEQDSVWIVLAPNSDRLREALTVFRQLKPQYGPSLWLVVCPNLAFWESRTAFQEKLQHWVPASSWGRVLIDWENAFAQSVSVDEEDWAQVFLREPDGSIRGRYGFWEPQAALEFVTHTFGPMDSLQVGQR